MRIDPVPILLAVILTLAPAAGAWLGVAPAALADDDGGDDGGGDDGGGDDGGDDGGGDGSGGDDRRARGRPKLSVVK